MSASKEVFHKKGKKESNEQKNMTQDGLSQWHTKLVIIIALEASICLANYVMSGLDVSLLKVV